MTKVSETAPLTKMAGWYKWIERIVEHHRAELEQHGLIGLFNATLDSCASSGATLTSQQNWLICARALSKLYEEFVYLSALRQRLLNALNSRELSENLTPGDRSHAWSLLEYKDEFPQREAAYLQMFLECIPGA